MINFPLAIQVLSPRLITKLETSSELIEKAVIEKTIRNVDYQQAKKDLGNCIGYAFNKFYTDGRLESESEEVKSALNVIVYSTHDLLNLDKKIQKISSENKTDYVKEVKALCSEFKPVSEKVKLVKDYVVKGRIVKEKTQSEINKEKKKRTCPCCFGKFANIKDKMVHHGYKRPGHGYQTESCFGFSFPPFELSNLGTVRLVEFLTDLLKKREERLPVLKEESEITVFNSKTLKLNTLKKGDDWFEIEHDREIRIIESEIIAIKRDLVFLAEKLKNWTKTE